MRPTMNDLRQRVGLPIAPPPRNETEPCKTCADANGALGYDDGRVDVFCAISRERALLYPCFRPVTIPENAIMPCWRPR